jgi:hypothetical protein
MLIAHDPTRALRPPVPREHGAWGILGGAFFLVIACTGAFTAGMAAFLLATVAFYFSRHALLSALRKRPASHGAWWFAAFALCGLLLLAAAASAADYWPIIVWSTVLIPFFSAELILIYCRKQQSFPAQLIGTAGLTAVAPLSHMVYAAGLTRDAGIVWLLAILFFSGLILFVRFQIHSMSSASGRAGLRRNYRIALMLYNGILLTVLIAAAIPGGRFARSIVPFIPSILQAFAAGIGFIRAKTVRQLGWLQMAHTLAFVLLAALFLRG